MKKILFLGILIVLNSCSKENSLTEEKNIESINYHYAGTTFTIDFEKNSEDELTPIESDAQMQIDKIIDANENLIFHDIDANNIMLFSSDKELSEYLNNNGVPLIEESKNSRSTPYAEGNLSMYIDSYFKGAVVHWAYPSYSFNCYQSATPEERLKNFATTNNWIVRQGNFVVVCPNNTSFGNKPNDKVSSVIVRNVFARFYEHANHRGRSITRDARYGSRFSAFNRLKSVRYRGKWDNRISSVKLSF